MKTSPLSPKGERTAPPGRVDQNLTDILSDILSDVFVLVSTFPFHFQGVGIRIFLKPTPKFCIRFVK
jgi:hypothetical protein